MKTLHRSFAGGEITPEAWGRLDLTKYQTGAALIENFQVLPHGHHLAKSVWSSLKPRGNHSAKW